MSSMPDFLTEGSTSYFGNSNDAVFDDSNTSPESLLNNSPDFERGFNTVQDQYDDSMTLHEKRKAESQQALTNKTAKSHQSSVHGQDSKPGKKPGRKLDPNEPASKRKAQNRAAQRAFRERKEKHLKDMEDRVKELEAEAAATNNENEFLKLQVERLQKELKKYRGSAGGSTSDETSSNAPPSRPFTFEFPFFNNEKSNKTNAPASKNAYPSPRNSASSMDSSPQTNVSKDGISPRSSATSSSSPFSLMSGTTPASSASVKCEEEDDNEEKSFCGQLQLACGCSDDPVPQIPASKPQKKTTTIAPAVKKPSITTGTMNEKKEEVSLFSPPPLDFDFLGSYRDPLFETTDFQLPELATTEYSMFDALENPLVNESFNSMGEMVEKQNTKPSSDEVVPIQDKYMSCSAVWDRISSHPKFNDLDIDGLCTELRTKAKCSDSGVMLTEKDVDKVLSSF